MLTFACRSTIALVAAASSAFGQCSFTTPPQSVSTCVGGFVSFSVATNPGLGTYQWFRSGVPVGSNGPFLFINNAQPAEGDLIWCRFTPQFPPGATACTSPTARINFFTGPVITATSGDQAAVHGAPLTLSVTATSPSPTYQWTFNDVPIVGATGPTLTMVPVDAIDAGTYSCIVTSCGVAGQGAPMHVSVRADAAARYYSEFIRTIIATEVVRSAHLRTPRPRIIGVLAALDRVAARNPSATPAQLAAFVTAYNAQLAAAYPQDPDLRFGFDFQAAVRFVARVTTVPGLDTDVGEEVLLALGFAVDAPSRQLQMTAFQDAAVFRLAASDAVAETLRRLLSGENPAARDQAFAFLRAAGIEPAPTRAQLQSDYPEIIQAIATLPETPEAFFAERAAGFPTLRARAMAELAAVSSFIDGQIARIDQFEATYPTLESVRNASQSQQHVTSILAQRSTDLLAIARSRSILSLTTAAMFQGNVEQQQQAVALRQYSNVTIQFASSTMDSVLSGLNGVGNILSGIGGLTGAEGPGGMVSGAGNILKGVAAIVPLVTGEPATVDSPFQQVSNQITELRNQLESLRGELNDRFNRVDAGILTVYDAVNSGFNAVNAHLMGITQNVQAIQLEIATAQSNLNRFEQNLYGVLADGFNFPFIADMNTALGYRQRLGQDLALSQFGFYEGRFFSASTSDASSQTYAGPSDTLNYDQTALAQLSNFPLGFNINNLRAFPSRILGLPALGNTRVPNPTSWSLNADAYAKLARENPWYFARTFVGQPDRFAGVLSSGQAAQSVMSNARSQTLFNRLVTDYNSRVATLQAGIDAVQTTYLTSQLLTNLNPWGGPGQTIPGATFGNPSPRFTTYNGVCGSDFCTIAAPLNGVAAVWDVVPPEYKVASFLGLPNRTLGGAQNRYHFCYRQSGATALDFQGQWTLAPNGTTYTATIDVELWWNPMNERLFNNLFLPGTSTTMQRVLTRRFQFTMNPNTFGWSNFPLDAFRTRWSTAGGGNGLLRDRLFLDNQSADFANDANGQSVRVFTASTVIEQPTITQARADVNNQLRALQAGFYQTLVIALSGGADPTSIRPAADLCSTNIRLIDFYLALAAPEALAGSDLLRGALRGNELNLDKDAFIAYFAGLATSVLSQPPGTAAPTTRPTIASEAARRMAIFQPELNTALALTRPEQYPFMKWTLASLQHLQATSTVLAHDNQYVTPPNQTLIVPAAQGLLANDALQPAASITAVLVTPPATGTLTLNPSGAFSFTPPAGFIGQVSFTYRARGDIEPPLNNIVLSQPASVIIRVEPCLPVIASQPQSVPYAAGQSVALTVGASATSHLSYQWLRFGSPLADGATPAGTVISGSTTPTLILQHLHDADIAAYACEVTSACGTVVTAAAAIGSPCRADFNGDTNLNPDDLSDFITCFFTQTAFPGSCTAADFNADGTIDPDDLSDFITAFFTGC